MYFALRTPYIGIRPSSLLSAKSAAGLWFEDALANQWTIVPGGSLSASGVMETGAGAIVSAWGGGVVNTVGIYSGSTFIPGTFLSLWGGGHGDYSGNEIYPFGPLESASPTWYKPRNPTSPAPINVSEDGSGNPVARHTYQSITYLGGARNWMLATGGVARSTDANGVGLTHVFDFNQTSPNTNQPWSTKANPPAPADVTCYESTSGLIWSHPNAANEVQTYDVATDTYSRTLFKSPGWSTGNAVSAIDTNRGIWAIYWSGGINFFRTDSAALNDYYTPSTTGTAPTGAGSILWDPVADAFKVWNGNGKQLFTLTPPASSPYQGGNAWTWSNATASSGDTPDSQSTNGTFGRFNYIDNGSGLRGYILLNSASSSAYFYKT